VSSDEIDEVECSFEETEWTRLKLTLNTCKIEEGSFGEPGSIISNDQDETVKAFWMDDKYQTFYLPVNFFEKFPNLFAVNIEKCSIRHIGNEFQGLKELQALYLVENKIKTIDDQAFKDNTKLNLIDLNNNRIKYVKPVWFEQLTSLRTLHLNNNNIRYVDPLTFTSLVSIENINLNDNEISYLDPKTFENLLNLKNFTAANNDLTVVEKDLFKTNVKLHRVVFDYNTIKVMYPDMFDGNENMFMIDLYGNPCVSGYFGKDDFSDMKTKLKEKCSDESQSQAEKLEYEGLKSVAETCKFF
jgi:hypothetical protein